MEEEEAIFFVFAVERHQQQKKVPSIGARHVCIPNTAKCSIKMLLTSHYIVCNFYPGTKARLHAPRPLCLCNCENLDFQSAKRML